MKKISFIGISLVLSSALLMAGENNDSMVNIESNSTVKQAEKVKDINITKDNGTAKEKLFLEIKDKHSALEKKINDLKKEIDFNKEKDSKREKEFSTQMKKKIVERQKNLIRFYLQINILLFVKRKRLL